MTSGFGFEFGILFGLALVGGLAVLPYGLRLLKASHRTKPLKMSIPKLLFLSFLQTAVQSAIAIAVGLLAARAIGLGAPFVEAIVSGQRLPAAGPMLTSAVTFGVVGGFLLLLMDFLFLPYWPEALLNMARKTTQWENFTGSFYGGLNEEFLLRLFGLSVVAWLLSRIWHTAADLPTSAIFWVTNLILAILFGLGHLPALKSLAGKISPMMLARTLLLNAPIGLLCGWLFWTYGIETAVVAHFSADIVYHVGGTMVLRWKDGRHPVQGTSR